MSDKSPRYTMSKKSSKSLKEKRADKRAAAEKSFGEKLAEKKRGCSGPWAWSAPRPRRTSGAFLSTPTT
ncbi:hypothetical protein GCM10027061_11560 [Nesterenkonia suensis]